MESNPALLKAALPHKLLADAYQMLEQPIEQEEILLKVKAMETQQELEKSLRRQVGGYQPEKQTYMPSKKEKQLQEVIGNIFTST